MSSMKIGRRTVLRGLGAGSVLLSGITRTLLAEAAAPNLRAAFFFHANGAQWQWTPSAPGPSWTAPQGSGKNPSGLDPYVGPDYVLSPHLTALEPVRKNVTIIKRLTLGRESGHPHRMATRGVLGCGAPTSFDQTLAMAVGNTTPIPFVDYRIGTPDGAGGFAASLSQVDNVLVPGNKTGGTFLQGETSPVAAYQRIAPIIAGGTMTGPQVNQLLVAKRSMLDFVRNDVSTYSTRLSSIERPKLQLYLQGLRDLENTLGASLGDIPASCGTPLSAPTSADVHMEVADMATAVGNSTLSRLFLDVMALAMSCGVTRIAVMMWGGGENDKPVPFIGIQPGLPLPGWHGISHNDPSLTNAKGGALMAKMHNYLAGEYAYFLQKLASYPSGTGSVLDESVVVWGTQNGNSCQTAFSPTDHDPHNSPFVVGGKLGGGLKPGNLIDGADRKHNDVYIKIAQVFGLPMTTVGDPSWCQGPLPGLG
jgi:Protein of unknown function (DUF1552)